MRKPLIRAKRSERDHEVGRPVPDALHFALRAGGQRRVRCGIGAVRHSLRSRDMRAQLRYERVVVRKLRCHWDVVPEMKSGPGGPLVFG
jgi:hypothetical protein